MERLIRILIEILACKGMELASIPEYLRDLGYILSVNSHMTMDELNRHLGLLGWDHFELDLNTLYLIVVTFGTDISFQTAPNAGIASLPLRAANG